jgi:uncharacterized membrane protein
LIIGFSLCEEDVSAAAILVVGWLRVVYFEKGLDYYSTNLAFIGKMAFFVAVALLPIYPSRVFISWRKVLTRGHPPSWRPIRCDPSASFSIGSWWGSWQ